MDKGDLPGRNALLHQPPLQFVIDVEPAPLGGGVVAEYDLAAPGVFPIDLHDLPDAAAHLGLFAPRLLPPHQPQIQRRLPAVGAHLQHIVRRPVYLLGPYPLRAGAQLVHIALEGGAAGQDHVVVPGQLGLAVLVIHGIKSGDLGKQPGQLRQVEEPGKPMDDPVF